MEYGDFRERVTGILREEGYNVSTSHFNAALLSYYNILKGTSRDVLAADVARTLPIFKAGFQAAKVLPLELRVVPSTIPHRETLQKMAV